MFFRLTRELRDELKRPLGELVRGPIPEPYLKVRGELEKHPVVTVGDVVTENVLKIGVKPIIALYDLKTKRKEYSPEIEDTAVFLTVTNPPGTITKALLDTVRKAFGLAERGETSTSWSAGRRTWRRSRPSCTPHSERSSCTASPMKG